MDTQDVKERSEKAFTFEQLKVGMEVTLLHIIVTVNDDWIKAHTGTITAINTEKGFIAFDFPNKELDKTPAIPMHRFAFGPITDDDDKRLFLVNAMELATIQDTAFTQQSLRNRITMSQ
jgi:hypothetical protein